LIVDDSMMQHHPDSTMTKRQFYFWLGLFAFGTIGYTVVQDYLRPGYRGESELLRYWLGVAPNYFAGLALPSFFVVMIAQFRTSAKQPLVSAWWNVWAPFSAMLVAFVGLTLWEFTQTITARGRFDWHDIGWTMVGTLTFYAVWRVVNRAA
jgi:hypothetical protein